MKYHIAACWTASISSSVKVTVYPTLADCACAIKSALSHKANDKELIVLENLVLETPKTKEMRNILETLKIADKKILLVVNEFEENLILSSRNLANVVLISADELNVLDIVGTDVMVITEAALKQVEEVLK